MGWSCQKAAVGISGRLLLVIVPYGTFFRADPLPALTESIRTHQTRLAEIARDTTERNLCSYVCRMSLKIPSARCSFFSGSSLRPGQG